MDAFYNKLKGENIQADSLKDKHLKVNDHVLNPNKI
jgi:hypothetical protein